MDSLRDDEWLNAWSAFQAPDSSSPWAAALAHWWRQAAPADKSDPGAQVFERMINQGRAFFALTEPLADAADGAGSADWRTSIDQALARLKRQFDDPQAASAALWQQPLDHWQRIASTVNGLPWDLIRSMAGTVAGPAEQIDRVLSAPGIGHTREFQEQCQALGKLLGDYQQAYRDYADAYLDMGRESIDLLAARVRESDTPVSSVRELYDLWVETSEAVYGQRVRSEEYAALHGRLINASMALRHQGSRMMEQFADAVNLPTRSEIDSMQARYQQTRRNERALRAELDTAQRRLRELAAELAQAGDKDRGAASGSGGKASE